MSNFRKCFKYERKTWSYIDTIYLIIVVFGVLLSVLLMLTTAFNRNQRGVYILCMMFVTGFENPGNKALKPLIMESPLRKYYLQTYRPLMNIISVTFCWLLYIVPYAVIQRNIGAEWFYTASMCLGMSLALTAISVSKAVVTGNNAGKMMASYLSAFVIFMPLVIILMSSPLKFKSAVAAVTGSGNVVFAASVLLMIFSAVFSICCSKISYRKIVYKPVRFK